MSKSHLNMANLRSQVKPGGQLQPEASQWAAEAGREGVKEQERNHLSQTGTWEKGKVWIERRSTMSSEMEYDHEGLRLSLVKSLVWSEMHGGAKQEVKFYGQDFRWLVN